MAVLIWCLYLIAAALVERSKFFSVWTAFVKWVTTTCLWTRASALGLPAINLGSLWTWFQIEVPFWQTLETDSMVERARMKECLEHRLMYLPRWCHCSLGFGTQSTQVVQLLNLQGEVEFQYSSNTSWALYFHRKDCNCVTVNILQIKTKKKKKNPKPSQMMGLSCLPSKQHFK